MGSDPGDAAFRGQTPVMGRLRVAEVATSAAVTAVLLRG